MTYAGTSIRAPGAGLGRSLWRIWLRLIDGAKSTPAPPFHQQESSSFWIGGEIGTQPFLWDTVANSADIPALFAEMVVQEVQPIVSPE